MGSKQFRLFIYLMILYVSISSYVVQSRVDSYDPNSLDLFIRDYTFKKVKEQNPVTGTLYNISLLSNFSGIDVSFVRLRTGRLLRNGASYGFFEIRPRILPWPYVKRLDIIYQSLGNWSSYYYNVPNHTFAAPVIGFLAYDSDSSVDTGMISLSVMGDPIEVQFPRMDLPNEYQNVQLKCVRFGHNGLVQFSNMTKANTCLFKDQGHFSIVAPSQSRKKKRKAWKWWVVGFVVGVFGLALLILALVFSYKVYRLIKIKKMERQAERSEPLDSIWIQRSRMPSAAGIRTQPVLETSDIP